MRLTTVILNTGDSGGLGEVRRWYEDNLGLTPDSEVPDHSVWYQVGPTLLGLHVGDRLQNPASACIGFEVDDVDDLFERLRARGVAFDGEPASKRWGARAVSAFDPVGHTVTLMTPDRA
jgi:catechol 2,3-dioxygenase-like lactoylglutathione lyase family enzyme